MSSNELRLMDPDLQGTYVKNVTVELDLQGCNKEVDESHMKQIEYVSKYFQKTVQVLRGDVCDIGKYADTDMLVQVNGWICVSRRQGQITFLLLRDGTGKVQVMIPKPVLALYKEQVEHLRREASISLVGSVHRDKRAPTGLEIHVSDFEIIGKAEGIDQINDQTGTFDRFNYRHLVLREDRASSVMKVRHYTQQFLREFFIKERCFEVTPPTITKGECEGGSSVFKFKYYDMDASLTQSSQLYLETVIPIMKRVFCILPSYRAEKSTTRRHLAEYTHVEGEFAFITFDDLLSFIERMIAYVYARLLEDEDSRVLVLELNPNFKVPSLPFKRMKYSDAITFLKEHEMYKDAEAKTHFVYGDDIPEAPERKMTDMIGEPVFMTHFPHGMKAFYMGRDPNNNEETESADLLYPGVGEIVGGSMRLTDYEKLMDGFKTNDLDPKPYEFYSDQRRYGTCPHGGFGLGLERLLMCITAEDNIKGCCLYPRFAHRCTP